MTDASVSFFARLWLAILCAFRVVFDPRLASRVRALLAPPEEGTKEGAVSGTASKEERDADAANEDALGLLALLQREGRLVDFLKQEIDAFPDADVGAAARVVHSGCRKALLGHFELSRIRTEPEGTAVTVPEGFDGRSIKLTGNVRGSAPYRGVLRHAGWRVDSVRLPALVAGYDAKIIAPAEVEL
ncbi:MAG TPA: DUF2760 domain-containing protein [Polyangiaceae bacterium]|nr:DUF2760 domain-containing protein [Polyangiaceae bacterium]